MLRGFPGTVQPKSSVVDCRRCWHLCKVLRNVAIYLYERRTMMNFNHGSSWCLKYMALGPPVVTRSSGFAVWFCVGRNQEHLASRLQWDAIYIDWMKWNIAFCKITAICRQGSESTLTNQCWLITSELQWHSTKMSFTWCTTTIND